MIVGMSIAVGIPIDAELRRWDVVHLALRHFPWLGRTRITHGATTLELWGFGALEADTCPLADGSLLVRVGWPVGAAAWVDAARMFERTDRLDQVGIPWDGRLLLVRISADGERWDAWSDWTGSIPLYHAGVGDGRIASTLEPVTVAVAGLTPADIAPASAVSLLLNGHFVGDWTLYREMRVLPADTHAVWERDRWSARRVWSVGPSEDRWSRGWDELADEMYELMREAVLGTLRLAPEWTLPLSGGVDSRLIAAFGAEAGIPMFAYTYGPAAWRETLYAREVASALGLPWKRVDLGTDYLVKYSRMWGDWFGSAMHFHGMYQMPFLEAVRDVPHPIVTGFIGDPHGGAQTAGMAPGERTMLTRLTDKWRMWSADELRGMFRGDLEAALQAIEAELESEYESVPGAHYQKVWMTFQWSHVFGFSTYQPTMYDYWKGCGTPFVHRELARFTLSLPRLALEGRRLQIDMMKRRLPRMAAIPVTFLGMPFKLTRGWLLRRGIAEALPRALRRGPLREFNPLRNTLDQDAIRAGRHAAVWPVYEAWEELHEWLKLDAVVDAHKAAAAGDLQAVNKLEALQALALRLRRAEPTNADEHG